ncbi:MAG TPA: M56 and DUF3738 domain-containing protein [Bryobacteraceae bacterium]
MITHLIQSTIFAALLGLLTLLLRNNRAATRYWIWLAASLKFLVPFSLFVEIGHRLTWTTTPVITQPQLSFVLEQVVAPVYVATSPAPAVASASSWPILPALWIFGSIAVLIFWLMRWQRVARSLRRAVVVRKGRAFDRLRLLDVRTKLVALDGSIEPGVFSILRPVLYLPDGISEHLNDAQLDAIFLHELTHIRRRDNLTAALHMLVEAVFWFHPSVWWMGARLVEERERACDEEVVRLGSDPEVYAESILKICRHYLESPLVCASGVTGSDLRKRIEAIMSSRVILRLNFAKKAVLAIAGAVALALPVLIGIVNVPGMRAQSNGPVPKFDAASIRPAEPGGQFMFGLRPMPGGRISGSNVTLKLLITSAYGVDDFQVSGGPGWMETARYNIEATPASPVGPDKWKEELQDFLAERFHLAFHRETREVPVYALVLAKKDGALGPDLVPSKPGDCVARDPSKPPGEAVPGQPPFCGNAAGGASQLSGTATTIDSLSRLLSRAAGRKVIDKTGLTGTYNIRLKWAPPAATPADGSGPSLFTVLPEQLGLKLEPQKTPMEVFVIDRAEKPSEN